MEGMIIFVLVVWIWIKLKFSVIVIQIKANQDVYQWSRFVFGCFDIV